MGIGLVKGKIMIVDDEEGVRESLKLFLSDENYIILEAENGEEAIAQLRSGDHMLSVGLIICDIHMPKVDGLECIEFFLKEASGIPIVVVTGFPDAEIATNLITKGCFGYLTKPVEKENFLETVKKAMAAKKGVGL